MKLLASSLTPLAASALLLVVPAAQAQMYKCVDASGKTRYSDKPIPDCKSASTIAAPPPSAPSASGKPPATGKPPAFVKAPPTLDTMKGQLKGTKKEGAAKKGAPPPRSQTAAAPVPTERDKKYAAAQCRTLKEEEAWLLGKRGAKVEDRDARLGQIRQGLAACP